MNSSRWMMATGALVILLIIALVFMFASPDETAKTESSIVDSKLLEQGYSIRLGDENAKVTLVEFFDPACGTCANFYPFVKQLMADNPNQIQLVMRYAPFHQGSDFVVMLLEAARLQNLFWETLEVLYANQSAWTQQHVVVPERVVQLLSQTDLDMQKLQADYQNAEIISRVQQDLANAKSIPVTQTPEFFVNGRPLVQFGYQQLQDLVEDEIAEQY